MRLNTIRLYGDRVFKNTLKPNRQICGQTELTITIKKNEGAPIPLEKKNLPLLLIVHI